MTLAVPESRYEPLFKAPKNARSLLGIVMLFDVLKVPEETLKSYLLALSKGPGTFFLESNKSFHAFNYNIHYITPVKKINLVDMYPSYGEYKQIDGGYEARDFDIFFLSPDDYKVVERMERDRDSFIHFVDETETNTQYILEDSQAKQIDTVEQLFQELEKGHKVGSSIYKLSRRHGEDR